MPGVWRARVSSCDIAVFSTLRLEAVKCRVAVRIIRKPDGYHVIGRKTRMVCTTFDEAWEASIPYFAGRKW